MSRSFYFRKHPCYRSLRIYVYRMVAIISSIFIMIHHDLSHKMIFAVLDVWIKEVSRVNWCLFSNPLNCGPKFLQTHDWPGGSKGKEEYLYSAFSHQGTYKALRHGSHSLTCKQHHACLAFVAFTRCHHHSNWGSRHPIAAHYSFIDPERMKGWVSLVGWVRLWLALGLGLVKF